MKARKVVTVKPTDAYGPHIAAKLKAGEIVSVAVALLKLRAEDVAPPALELTLGLGE
jgi:hypothetical protein